MRQHTIPFVGLVAGTVLLASACSDTSQLTSPSDQPAGTGPTSSLQQPDDPVALVRQVPGFGGFFYDAQGTPTLYLKDVAVRGTAERALQPFFSVQGLSPSALRVRKADFDWASLERWQSKASTEALAARGAVFVDADEASNRVRIGIERGTSAAEVNAVIARLGIPSSAVIVQETDPVIQLATLQQRIRPVPGGVQINFPGFLCSIGFNATRSGQRSFITASHCTNTQGGQRGNTLLAANSDDRADPDRDRGVRSSLLPFSERLPRRSEMPLQRCGPRRLCQQHEFVARRDRKNDRRQQQLADDFRKL